MDGGDDEEEDVEDDDVLDEDIVPMIVNSGLAFPESPNTVSWLSHAVGMQSWKALTHDDVVIPGCDVGYYEIHCSSQYREAICERVGCYKLE